jgi:hypothetical protein
MRDKIIRDPTVVGGGVSHSTDSMLTYHSGAFDGRRQPRPPACGAALITVSDNTSTATPRLFTDRSISVT